MPFPTRRPITTPQNLALPDGKDVRRVDVWSELDKVTPYITFKIVLGMTPPPPTPRPDPDKVGLSGRVGCRILLLNLPFTLSLIRVFHTHRTENPRWGCNAYNFVKVFRRLNTRKTSSSLASSGTEIHSFELHGNEVSSTLSFLLDRRFHINASRSR